MAASSAWIRSPVGQQSGEPDEGFLRQRHHLRAHQCERGVAIDLRVGAEVYRSAPRSPFPDRCVRRRAPAVRRGDGFRRNTAPRASSVRRAFRAAARLQPLPPDPRRVPAVDRPRLLRRARQRSRVALLRRYLHAHAGDVFEERPVRKRILHEPPFAVGQVAERARPGEDVLVRSRGVWPARRAPWRRARSSRG